MPKRSLDGNGYEPSAACLQLTSGEVVRVEATSRCELEAPLGALGGAVVSWCRVGEACEIDEGLVREGRHRPPDLLVLIGRNGWPSALGRAREIYGNLPILAAGYAADDEPLALDAGADGYCGLPLDGRIFGARIRAMLRRHSGRLRAAQQEALELDAKTRILRVAETAVQLSPREYDLVVLLYEQREHWVPRAVLLEALSRNQAVYDSSLLRMHMLNVRNKLGVRRWMLQTVRGKGVMLTANGIYQASSRGSGASPDRS